MEELNSCVWLVGRGPCAKDKFGHDRFMIGGSRAIDFLKSPKNLRVRLFQIWITDEQVEGQNKGA